MLLVLHLGDTAIGTHDMFPVPGISVGPRRAVSKQHRSGAIGAMGAVLALPVVCLVLIAGMCTATTNPMP